MARRLSLEPCATGLKKWPWRVNLPPKYTSTGKRQRHFFRNRREADTFCHTQRIRLDNYGRNSSTLTPGQQEEAAMAFEKLSPYNMTLTTVVADFIARHEARVRSVTFKVLFDRFVAAKKNRSEAYLRGLKYTLPRFAELHDRKVCDIAPADIDAETNGMTPAVRNAFLRNLRAVFNFGVKRNWLEANPISKLDFEIVRKDEVVTLTTKKAESLMIAADNDNDLLPYHALGLFAGVRPLELQRLEWGNIDLVEHHIEITSAVSKTGRRRIIDMEPNLDAWLNHYIAKGGKAAGKVTPVTSNLRNRLREIRKAAGLSDWTQDVMRHSYASYWLAEHGDINRLTLQMGHESADMLWRHYHKAAKRKEAEHYWRIMPPPIGNKVITFFEGV